MIIFLWKGQACLDWTELYSDRRADYYLKAMACATTVVLVVVIADSRGADLQMEFNMLNTQPFDVKVLTFRGKGILDAVKLATPKLIWWAPKIIVILNGLCDLTSKNKETKIVNLGHDSTEAAVTNHIDSMDHARHYLYIQLIEAPCQLVFSHIVGMDLMKCNNEIGPNGLQHLLNDCITEINVAVNQCNEMYDAVSPWLVRDVHRNTKGKKVTRYHKFSEDGVHLTEELKRKCAAEIDSALRKNWEKMLSPAGRPGNLHPAGSEILTLP